MERNDAIRNTLFGGYVHYTVICTVCWSQVPPRSLLCTLPRHPTSQALGRSHLINSSISCSTWGSPSLEPPPPPFGFRRPICLPANGPQPSVQGGWRPETGLTGQQGEQTQLRKAALWVGGARESPEGGGCHSVDQLSLCLCLLGIWVMLSL